jgi:aryl-alcohol dehydrogenase (NADP+)
MYAYQFAKSLYLADLNNWTRFVSMQNHYNLIYREEEREMNRFCLEEGIGLIPWSPLARGFLAGNRTPDKSGATTRSKSDTYAQDMYYAEEDFEVVGEVERVAKSKGVKPTQVALAWLLQRPGVVAPIIGATKMLHLEDAIGSLEVRLSPEEIQSLEKHYVPHPVLGHS